MKLRIDHPTDRPNFTIVHIELGNSYLSLAFSYETVVGYKRGWAKWVVTQNYWGPTTGKHLNYLNDDHSQRVDADTFEAGLSEALASLN